MFVQIHDMIVLKLTHWQPYYLGRTQQEISNNENIEHSTK